jgi:hypothetical protein
MRKAAFLIPASPTPAFLSQIAAFELALRRLPWVNWSPSVTVCFGEIRAVANALELERWRRHMPAASFVFVPEDQPNEDYYNQIDGLYRWAPADADVLVRCDADTLPVSGLEEILDFVHERSAIAGTIAHFHFPRPPQQSNREAWLDAAAGFLTHPLAFDHAYSLAGAPLSAGEKMVPFYVNDGVVFFARRYFDVFAPRYLTIRPALMERLHDGYFAGQIALALAAAEIDLPRLALPLRYNFPNDELAAKFYPLELQQAVFFHYLRCNQFDRRAVFASADGYRKLVSGTFSPANEMFRSKVIDLFGEDYPFAGEGRVPLTAPPRGGRCAPPTDLAQEAEWIQAGKGNLALEPLMQAKQSLVAKLGREEGFLGYRRLAGMPETTRLVYRSMVGQRAFAERRALHLAETCHGGESFTIPAAKIAGVGRCEAVTATSRKMHVACVENVRVRANSEIVETDSHALLDILPGEPEQFDCEYDIDSAVFEGDRRGFWLFAGDAGAEAEIEEAFTLLGPQLGAWGDFMVQYLPRLLFALQSGNLPVVPVLINQPCPDSILRMLSLLLPPNMPLRVLPAFTPLRVRKLWCASNLAYAPAREVFNERYSALHQFVPPAHIGSATAYLRRRLLANAPHGQFGKRVYLARRPQQWRRLVNAEAIEAIARKAGFVIVYPQDHALADQIAMLADASHVIAPEGSALFLCYFSAPGTRLCILQHDWLEHANVFQSYLPHCDVTIIPGPFVEHHPRFPHRGNYEISPNLFAEFLSGWLGEA